MDHKKFDNIQSSCRSDVTTGIVVCSTCKSVLKYDCKTTESLLVKRHTENCKSPQNKNEQALFALHFNIKEVKLNDLEKLDIKNAELEFCMRGYHSFNSSKNEGLITLLQTFVNIVIKDDPFDMRDVLYTRNGISTFPKEKAAKVKLTSKDDLVEFQESKSLAVTLNSWTADKQQIQFCIDIHAFKLTNHLKLRTGAWPNVILKLNVCRYC